MLRVTLSRVSVAQMQFMKSLLIWWRRSLRSVSCGKNGVVAIGHSFRGAQPLGRQGAD